MRWRWQAGCRVRLVFFNRTCALDSCHRRLVGLGTTRRAEGAQTPGSPAMSFAAMQSGSWRNRVEERQVSTAPKKRRDRRIDRKLRCISALGCAHRGHSDAPPHARGRALLPRLLRQHLQRGLAHGDVGVQWRDQDAQGEGLERDVARGGGALAPYGRPSRGRGGGESNAPWPVEAAGPQVWGRSPIVSERRSGDGGLRGVRMTGGSKMLGLARRSALEHRCDRTSRTSGPAA